MSEMPLINKSNEDFIGETEDALRHYAITHHPHDWTAEVWNAINRMKQSLVMEHRYRMLVKQTRELEARHSELVEAAREVGLLREEFKISSALRSGRNPNEIQKEFLVKLDELAKLAEVK